VFALRDGRQPVLDWLIDGARSDAPSEEVLASLCQRLIACGMPLSRVAVFVTTLHPDVMGRRRFLWKIPALQHRKRSSIKWKRMTFGRVHLLPFIIPANQSDIA